MKQQIQLLFAMLPSQYQPIDGLKNIAKHSHSSDNKNKPSTTTTTATTRTGEILLSADFTKDFTMLLPTNIYTSTYSPSKQSFVITPSIMMPSKLDSDFATTIITEEQVQRNVFGSIAPKPLKRQRPDLSLGIYSLFGLCGAAGCTLTHSLVIPFDVVKTKLQTNPDEYKNLIDGVVSISKEENGLQTFLLGAQATIVGYFWYGLSVYPCYSFSKWYLVHVIFDPASAILYMNLISLVAGAIAAVVASIGLTPIEAARIRTVAEPNIYRELGLIGTLKRIANEDSNLQWKSLYAGFPSLVTRQGESKMKDMYELS